jgi:hypothetical protein
MAGTLLSQGKRVAVPVYRVAGKAANMRKTARRRLWAACGAFALVKNPAALAKGTAPAGRRIVMPAASYATKVFVLPSVSIRITSGRYSVPAATGRFALVGGDVRYKLDMNTVAKAITAAKGSYVLSGRDSTLTKSGGPNPSGYYVATNGNAGNPGTIGQPWTLVYALSGANGTIHAGDTVWIRGGTYMGSHSTSISGTNGHPIIFRAYPGERANLDGNLNQDSTYALEVTGSYVWLWGLEASNSNTNRWSAQATSWPDDNPRNQGFKASGNGIKFINCIAHDNGENFTAQAGSGDFEMHGCLGYYCGWNAPDRGHGHGLYTQNATGHVKTIKNNFFLEPAFPDGCNAIQAYGSSGAAFQDSTITGNLFTRASTIIGGLSGFPLTNNAITNNMMWGAPGGGNVNFGDKSTDCSGTVVTGNYLANTGYSSVFAAVHPSTGLDIHGNTIIGDLDESYNSSDYPNNTWISKGSPPSTNVVFVLDNDYEPNRANVIIYNWQNLSSVAVNLSSVVANGTAINIYNTQNFFGSPVYSGTYNGGTVSIPMTGLVATPIVGQGINQNGGSPTLPDIGVATTTGPMFGAFIVRQQGA